MWDSCLVGLTGVTWNHIKNELVSMSKIINPRHKEHLVTVPGVS